MGAEENKKTDAAAGLEPANETQPVLSVNGQNADNEIEIDLVDLGYHLLEKIHYIILCLLIGAILLSAFAFFFITPTYKSTAKLYVVSASTDSVVNLSDLNLGTSLTSDYEELMLSYPVLDQVIEGLDLEMDEEDLKKMISLTNPSDTRILNVTVTSTDRELARDVANELADIAVDYLPKTMSTNAPNLAQEARMATAKSGPSYTRYTLIGAVLGALICCIYLIIIYLMDDTVHSADDMEKYFGLVPLTTVPESDVFVELEKKEDEGEEHHHKKNRRPFRRGKKK